MIYVSIKTTEAYPLATPGSQMGLVWFFGGCWGAQWGGGGWQWLVLSCHTGQLRAAAAKPRSEIFLWRRNLKKLTYIKEADQSSQLNRVPSLGRALAVGEKWNSLGPGRVVSAPSSLETFGLSLRAGISIFHGKLFTLNPLSALFRRPLKSLSTIIY